MEYKQMLENAYKDVRKNDFTSQRFESPKVQGYYEGKKTIITNFTQISSYIRRKPEHFQKYLLKGLASAGYIEGDRLVLNLRIQREKVDQKIKEYINEFVICRECGKPDTELIKNKNLVFIQCLACGAKHSITLKI